MNSARSVPVITVAMLVTWLVLASVPSWIEKVGLYQYLGVEILIFAIYALAYNIVLGHAGCDRSSSPMITSKFSSRK